VTNGQIYFCCVLYTIIAVALGFAALEVLAR
jgi:hypothetical protein